MSNFTLFFIFFYFIAKYIQGSEIIDLSQDCTNNLKSNYFLTYGMGYPDGVHILINNYHKNCTINLYKEKSQPKIVQLIFLEIGNGKNRAEFCENTNITIVSEGKAEKVKCENAKKESLFEGIFTFHKTSIKIVGNYFEKIQLKATSAKSVEIGEECETDENIICTINDTNFCIDSELQCEFYEYCGHYGSYNTIKQTCKLSKNLQLGFFKNNWLIVTAGLIFSVIILLILLKLCCLTIPKISRRFFKSSENLDNKLIVATQSLPIKKKISTKEIKTIMEKKRTVSEDFEREIQTSLYFQTGLRKKRLTTNSPVFRITGFSNNLLGSLSDDRTSQSSNLDDETTEDFSKIRRKRKSNLI